MIDSILTGVPVQTRGYGGVLTGAGLQQVSWCHELLKEMGKKDFIEKEVLGFKKTITKKQILEHLKNI